MLRRKADIFLSFPSRQGIRPETLSVHHNGSFDYLEEPVLQLDKMELIPATWEKAEEAIEAVPADVLAHSWLWFWKFVRTVEELKLLNRSYDSFFSKMIDYDLPLNSTASLCISTVMKIFYIYALVLPRSQASACWPRWPQTRAFST